MRRDTLTATIIEPSIPLHTHPKDPFPITGPNSTAGNGWWFEGRVELSKVSTASGWRHKIHKLWDQALSMSKCLDCSGVIGLQILILRSSIWIYCPQNSPVSQGIVFQISRRIMTAWCNVCFCLLFFHCQGSKKGLGNTSVKMEISWSAYKHFLGSTFLFPLACRIQSQGIVPLYWYVTARSAVIQPVSYKIWRGPQCANTERLKIWTCFT